MSINGAFFVFSLILFLANEQLGPYSFTAIRHFLLFPSLITRPPNLGSWIKINLTEQETGFYPFVPKVPLDHNLMNLKMKTFVLIHGSWHSSWNWHRVIPILEQLGHRIFAIDLPGMGRDKTPIREV